MLSEACGDTVDRSIRSATTALTAMVHETKSHAARLRILAREGATGAVDFEGVGLAFRRFVLPAGVAEGAFRRFVLPAGVAEGGPAGAEGGGLAEESSEEDEADKIEPE
jgi:hypothetical protein